jgi:hypothetical protein
VHRSPDGNPQTGIQAFWPSSHKHSMNEKFDRPAKNGPKKESVGTIITHALWLLLSYNTLPTN